MLAIGLLTLGIISRLITHIPNFTPVIALALFSGCYVKKKYAVLLPLALLAITDVFLGYHNTMFFTWGSIIIIAFTGLWVRKNKSLKSIFGTSLFSAILFFVVTNFGVWLVSGMYPLTVEGLFKCFLVAIPYFRNTVLSTFVYVFLLFGAYEYIAGWIKNTRFAHAL